MRSYSLFSWHYLIMIMIPGLLFAQNELGVIQSFTSSNGLPNNDVRYITQDHSGFLWIATWDGLVQYDGTEFRVYRHDPNLPATLGYFEVSMICVDKDNNVWTHSGNKICRYERAHDHFIIYGRTEFPEFSISNLSPYFHFMLVNKEGFLYVKYGNNLFRYNHLQDKFEKIIFNASIVDFNQIIYATFDNDGLLWLFQIIHGMDFGRVYQYKMIDSNSYSLTNTLLLNQKYLHEFLPNVTMHVKIIHSKPGNIFMATNFGLYLVSGDTIQPFERQILPGEFSGEEVVLWSQPGAGFMAYYPEDEKLYTLSGQKRDEQVMAYYADSEQNIWFTRFSSKTGKGGLELTYRTGDYFKQYLQEKNREIPTAVFGLVKDNEGNIWAGGRPNTHLVKISPDGEVKRIGLSFNPSNYYNYPRSMTSDKEGNIWMTSYDDYLFKFYPETRTFINYSDSGILSGYTYPNPRYRIVKLLSNGNLITIGIKRISIVDAGNFNGVFTEDPDFKNIYSICEDGRGNLWFGSDSKLIKTDLNLSDHSTFIISDNNYNIEDICQGDSADLWLAMLGGGLGHFEPSTGKTVFYSTSNGLAHNTVYAVMKDKSGNIWASHDLGISMFNIQTKNIINFSKKDGLNIREFDSEAAYQAEDGEMLFGGIGGIVAFHPDSVQVSRKETSMPLLISKFSISNKMVEFNQSVHELDLVKLPKGTDNFQLELIKPDLRYGEEIRYRYKLKGTKEDWIQTDSRHRRINYTSLKPGIYEFQAEATDLNGEWKYNTSLFIDIPFYFYQTLFFKVSLIVISIGIAVLIFTMKLKQNRLKEYRKYEQLKLETLHSQMNPHFIFNALNSVNYFITLNNPDKANQYLTDLSRLIRAIMSNSTQDFITLETEIQTLKDYLFLEHSQLSDKFDYEIQVDEAIDQILTEVTPSLIQPFIENAIKHGLRQLKGRKGNLSVRIGKGDDSFLVCHVEDDGIGRRLSVKQKTDVQKKRKSRGISIVEERLAIINSLYKTRYTIQISNLHDDIEETGTKARIEIPVKSPAKIHKISEI